MAHSPTGLDLASQITQEIQARRSARLDVGDFITSEIRTSPVIPVQGSARADEVLLEKIYRATDKNVDIQKRTANHGLRWEYRLFCTRCKEDKKISDTKIFLENKNIDDEIVIFCIKHRHDGGGNAMKVLSTFSDPQECAPVNEGRMFREDDE